MSSASSTEKEYFRRIASHNRALAQDSPPASLAEMFERLALIKSQLGPLAEPGRSGPVKGDLESHRAYLNRLHAIDDTRRA